MLINSLRTEEKLMIVLIRWKLSEEARLKLKQTCIRENEMAPQKRPVNM